MYPQVTPASQAAEDESGLVSAARRLGSEGYIDDAPLLELGRRIGRLLQESRDAADYLKKDAEEKAAVILQEARKVEAKARDEADRLLRKAKADASSLLESARTDAARLRDRAEERRRLGEAESTVLKREAQREAKLITKDAKARAAQIVDAATGQIHDRARELESRVRRLQVAERELQERIGRLRHEGETLRETPEPDVPKDEGTGA